MTSADSPRLASNASLPVANANSSSSASASASGAQSDFMEFKICVFGDGGIGKTTLCRYALQDLYSPPEYVMTIGAEVHTIDRVTDKGAFQSGHRLNCEFSLRRSTTALPHARYSGT